MNDTQHAKLRGMFAAYVNRWRDDQRRIEVIAIEETYTAPLYITADKAHPRLKIGGKIDKVCRIDPHERVLVDHKTTSLDIASDSIYWSELQNKSQHKHYELLLIENGYKIDAIMWDVIRKPALQLRKSETLDDYECRVADEMNENPDRYFRRWYVQRTLGELQEYAEELAVQAIDFERCIDEGSHYKNTSSCVRFNRPCKFLGICRGDDSPDSERWVVREDTHAELGGVDCEEMLLTNSRLSAWKTCRREHFYRYIKKLERADKQEELALEFGTAWHDLMDNFWANPEEWIK